MNASLPDNSTQPQKTGDRGKQATASAPLASARFGLLAKHRWAIFVLPFLVFMLVGQFQPTPAPRTAVVAPEAADGASDAQRARESVEAREPARGYPLQYALRLAATIAAVILVFPGYREFPLRIRPLAIVVGVVGVVIWVGLCRLNLESRLLAPLGLGFLVDFGQRVGFNPFESLGDRPGLLTAFLLVRFVGLAAVVPLIEEFFLRGFLMRFVMAVDWWKLPIGQVSSYAIFVGTAYGVLAHPAEMFAAAAWFSLVTWLMIKTRNIWDCVAAHAVTNLLLGIYVLVSHDWALW